MPITKNNWESFFQGAFAEHHVCSLFYFYGYEAYKASPDAGIDWLITNVARSRFNNEVPLNLQIQVKSALLDQSGAFVTMDVHDLDFLCEGEHRYCVFVLLSNLCGRGDPGSFERGDDPDAIKAVDRDIMNDMEARASVNGRSLRRDGHLSMYDFSKADVTLFWLHSSHLKRLRDSGQWKVISDDRRGLSIGIDGSTVSIAGITLIPELQELSYVVRSCRADSRIRQGQMSLDDY